jgi:hypothetical protein
LSLIVLEESSSKKILPTVYDVKEAETSEIGDDDEQQDQEEEYVTYDNPHRMIKQLERQIIETEQRYEQVIPPFRGKITAIVNNEEIPFIIGADPYKRSITSIEIDQEEVKKLHKKRR